MKRYFNFLIALLVISTSLTISCKKEEPPLKEDLYAEVPLDRPSSSALGVFHQPVAFYQLFVYRYDPETQRWGTRIASHFSSISATDPSYMGFTNTTVTDSGVAAFDMVRLYSTETGSTNIKNAKINIDQALQFFPDYEGSKTGVVKVKTQDVVITRTTIPGTFLIGISGEGTYNETSGLIDLKVTFDDSKIGGGKKTIDYKMSTVALSLN